MRSEFGKKLNIVIGGASHGDKLTLEMYGLPVGEKINMDELCAFMKRRAPSESIWSTQRRERDIPVIVSGITDGVTDGAVLRAHIPNTGARSKDYVNLQGVPRPGHADLPAYLKYGKDFDMSGGGFFSGRMTAPLCLAGGICLQILKRRGITVGAHALSVGCAEDTRFDPVSVSESDLSVLSQRTFPTLSADAEACMTEEMEKARREGDSLGGVIECCAVGLPVGIGGGLFDGLDGKIAEAVFGIPAVKAVEFGAGFSASRLYGSENNDAYRMKNGAPIAVTNNHGGILGGMTSSAPLIFRVCLKPVPSIAKRQKTVDLKEMRDTEIEITGRHDACIVPRAVPCVEAALALSLLDALLCERNAETLSDLRYELDVTDRALALMFKKRMRLSGRVAECKRESGGAVYDPAREAQIIDRVRELTAETCPDEAEELWRLILRLSREKQEKLLKRDT